MSLGLVGDGIPATGGGRSRSLLLNNVLSATLNIGLGIALIPRFGLVGTAFAALGGSTLGDYDGDRGPDGLRHLSLRQDDPQTARRGGRGPGRRAAGPPGHRRRGPPRSAGHRQRSLVPLTAPRSWRWDWPPKSAGCSPASACEPAAANSRRAGNLQRAQGGFASPQSAGARGTKGRAAPDVPRSDPVASPARSEPGARGTKGRAAPDVPRSSDRRPARRRGGASVSGRAAGS